MSGDGEGGVKKGMIRYSQYARKAAESLPAEGLLVKAAYACLVNSVCHYLFRTVLAKNTNVSPTIGGKRKWRFYISSGTGARVFLAFDIDGDGNRIVRNYTGESCHAEIEKAYRWAVSIAGPPPPELLDKLARVDRPRRPGRWLWIFKIILWPFALAVSMKDGIFTFQWTWRRILILLLSLGLIAVGVLDKDAKLPEMAFYMLLATFVLTMLLAVTKNWRPMDYFLALGHINQVPVAYQRYLREYEKTSNIELVEMVERLSKRVQAEFRETARRHTFPNRLGEFYRLLLSYFFIWARLTKTEPGARSEIVFKDIFLNLESHDAISWLTFWMDHKKLLKSAPDDFASPLNSPDTYLPMIDNLIREVGINIKEVKKKYGKDYNRIIGD